MQIYMSMQIYITDNMQVGTYVCVVASVQLQIIHIRKPKLETLTGLRYHHVHLLVVLRDSG